jgi:hypothetical protein
MVLKEFDELLTLLRCSSLTLSAYIVAEAVVIKNKNPCEVEVNSKRE